MRAILTDHSIGRYRSGPRRERIGAVKPIVASLCAVLLGGALFASSALADGWTFTENQAPDQSFHIDIGGSYAEQGQQPRNNNFGVGTIKVSLPEAIASFDPAGATDVRGYTCMATTSAYGEGGTGFQCSNDGLPQGGGFAFPTAVTLHLVSQGCYAPPAQGAAQPALVEVWAAAFDPGTAPDVSFPLYSGQVCTDESNQPVIEDKVLTCIVPNVKNRSLAGATGRLTHNRCKRGRVTFKPSSSVAKGKVISQSVKAGKKVKDGTKVNLVLSSGPKKKKRAG
jgi:hypothetical protein